MTTATGAVEGGRLSLAGVARRTAALTGWRRYAIAVGCGAAATAALPPLYIVPLLVPALVGLYWLVQSSRSGRGAFAAGWWFGCGHFGTGFYWVTLALLTEPEKFGWMVPFALFGLGAGFGIFTGLAGWAAWRTRTRGAAGVLAFALAWTAAEWLRGHILTGFPWNLAGSTWTFSESMIQVTALVGAYGLSLLTVAIFTMPAVLVPAAGSVAPSRAGRIVPVVLAALALVAVWAGGAARLASADLSFVPGVHLRIVQANIAQTHKWRDDLRQIHFGHHLRLSTAPGWERVTHVIWPETASPYFLTLDERRRGEIARVVPPGGLLLTGAVRMQLSAEGRPMAFWNSLHAVDAAGQIVETYDKHHLVPFGEYVPLRGYLPVEKLTHGSIDFSPGPGAQTLRLPGLPEVSPLVCYEAIFPGAVARDDYRPAWLLNITNDAWFGMSAGPFQHLMSARLRAVEEGVPLVRAANTGISAVVDPYGRFVGRLDLGVEGVLDAGLPVAIAPTPYARWGDLLLLGLAAGLLFIGVAASRFSRTV